MLTPVDLFINNLSAGFRVQTMKHSFGKISPKQIEADLLMGNFGCLQKQYGRPMQHNFFLFRCVSLCVGGGVLGVITDNGRRKER